MQDFYLLDEELAPEERQIRDAVRELVKKEILPHIGEWWIKGEFPTHLIKIFGEMGLLGITTPPEYGGLGLSKRVYGIVARELEYGDSGIRSFVSVQNSLVMYPILTFGSEEQKRKFLPKLASGELVGCYGLTEPDAGSDPGSMKTRAHRVSGGYVLNGTKMWITNGSISDIAIVWAKDDEGVVRGFIVERDFKGFRTQDIKTKLSLRASVTSELILEDVFVPDSYVLPKAKGLKAPLMCLTQARYGIAWGAVGVGMAVLEEALSYSSERIVFGKPLAAFQLTQEKLADMLADLTKIQLMVFRLAELMDSGRATFRHVSLAKRESVRTAKRMAEKARGILGANGITYEYHSMRHMANMEAVETYEGTYEIHTLILGEYLTGIPAYRLCPDEK
ncbi:MAG: acyl-CoA dehydrogenase [Thermotogae bacterium]|nr:acyl-CoA dehydrogenase [Thermotogota bacterium]